MSSDSEMKALATAIKDRAGTGALPYAGLLNSTLNGFRAATEKTTRAFNNDDHYGGAGGVMEMIGSLMPLAGILVMSGGPVAVTVMGLVGGFFSILGGVLAGLAPARKSLREEIEEALAEFHGKEIYDDLSAAKDDVTTAIDNLLEMADASRTWGDIQSNLNLTEGNAVHELNRGRSWLRENQGNPRWKDAFRAYWAVVALRTQYYGMMLPKLVDKDDSRRVALSNLRNKLLEERAFAREISDSARNAGNIWHVGDNRRIYHRTGLMSGESWNTEDGAADRVFVSMSDMLYGYDREERIVWAGRPGNRFGGGRRGLDNVIDFCVLPQQLTSSPSARANGRHPDALLLLTQGGLRVRWKLISKRSRTEDDLGDDNLRNWNEIRLPAGATRMVAAPGGVPAELDGDAPNNVRLFFLVSGAVHSVNGVLSSAAWILHQLPVVLREPDGKRFIGMAVDADYLYAYTPRRLFRTSLRSVEEGTAHPESVDLPRGLQEIRSISASNDGQILLVAGDDIWLSYATDKVRWRKEEAVQARWAVKRGIAGFDLCAAVMNTEIPAPSLPAPPPPA